MPESWVCLDASFAVGLATHPERKVFADLVDQWCTDGIRLAAPHLYTFEVTNAAHQYRRAAGVGDVASRKVLEAALALPIELMGDQDLHREAFHWAEELSLPAAYDAHYLALAGRLGCTLWSIDRRLIRAAGHPFTVLSPLDERSL